MCKNFQEKSVILAKDEEQNKNISGCFLPTAGNAFCLFWGKPGLNLMTLDLDDVLTMCMNFFSGANKAAATPGKSADEIFADTIMAVVYRVYLLGVEDGMREVAK